MSYHDRPELSHSQLECFRKNPALYYGRYVARTIPDERSDALEFGTLLHDFLLLGGANIVEVPDAVLTSNGQRRGGKWEDFVAAHPGKALILPQQWRQLRAMRDSIEAHPKARALMFDLEGLNERVLTWTQEGVACRCMVDRLLLNQGLAVDLKTAVSADPKDFAAAAYRYGYHRQAAWYLDGIAEQPAHGGDDFNFVFVVIEKTPPYRCEVIELDADFIELGVRENIDDFQRWRACRDAGIWQPPTFGQIVSVGVPRWAKYAAEWEYQEHGNG